MGTLDGYWNDLVNIGIATEEELQLVTDINGYSKETLDDVLYARTGYRDWEQYMDYEYMEDEE